MGQQKRREGESQASRTATRPTRKTGEQIGQSLAPKLRRAMQGPECLRCGKPVDLRRQSTGNGYLHSGCEEKLSPEQFAGLDRTGWTSEAIADINKERLILLPEGDIYVISPEWIRQTSLYDV